MSISCRGVSRCRKNPVTSPAALAALNSASIAPMRERAFGCEGPRPVPRVASITSCAVRSGRQIPPSVVRTRPPLVPRRPRPRDPGTAVRPVPGMRTSPPSRHRVCSSCGDGPDSGCSGNHLRASIEDSCGGSSDTRRRPYLVRRRRQSAGLHPRRDSGAGNAVPLGRGRNRGSSRTPPGAQLKTGCVQIGHGIRLAENPQGRIRHRP